MDLNHDTQSQSQALDVISPMKSSFRNPIPYVDSLRKILHQPSLTKTRDTSLNPGPRLVLWAEKRAVEATGGKDGRSGGREQALEAAFTKPAAAGSVQESELSFQDRAHVSRTPGF